MSAPGSAAVVTMVDLSRPLGDSVKACTIVSDGFWDAAPLTSGSAGAPVYLVGLGHIQQHENFQRFLNRHRSSSYYNAPDPCQTPQVFNEIRALSGEIGLMANDLTCCSGANYYAVRNRIAAGTAEAQLSVVWSDPTCHYTAGRPGGKAINVILIDPDGVISPLQPVIAEPGQAIFQLRTPQAGVWQALVQFDLAAPVWSTVAGLEFASQVRLEVDAPRLLQAGAVLTATVRLMDDGQAVEGLRVRAQLTRPAISTAHALLLHADALARTVPDAGLLAGGHPDAMARLAALRQLRLPQADILPVTTTFSVLPAALDGSYRFTCADTLQAGAYDVVLQVEGSNPATGRSFSRNKRFSTLVL